MATADHSEGNPPLETVSVSRRGGEEGRGDGTKRKRGPCEIIGS